MCNCRSEKLKHYRENDIYTPAQILVLNVFLLHRIRFCPFCGEDSEKKELNSKIEHEKISN
jgi:hypothetical protein